MGDNIDPLNLDYSKYKILVMLCWFKTFWERMSYYSFTLHLDLVLIQPPCERDTLMSYLFVGHPTATRISLNRYRISHKMLWQLDIVMANRRHIDKVYLLPALDELEAENSWFIFGREQPIVSNWLEWTVFWALFFVPGLNFHQPF